MLCVCVCLRSCPNLNTVISLITAKGMDYSCTLMVIFRHALVVAVVLCNVNTSFSVLTVLFVCACSILLDSDGHIKLTGTLQGVNVHVYVYMYVFEGLEER